MDIQIAVTLVLFVAACYSGAQLFKTVRLIKEEL